MPKNKNQLRPPVGPAMQQQTETKESPDKPVPEPVEPMETKEEPPTAEPEETESKSDKTTTNETSTTFAPSSDDSVEDGFYYNHFGERVIRSGAKPTFVGHEAYNFIVVDENVVQEHRLPGSQRVGTYQLFFRGQRIPITEANRNGLVKVGL